jgi:tetratricopeptide (TPR) repeat protein
MQTTRKFIFSLILIPIFSGLSSSQTAETNCDLKILEKGFKKSKSAITKADYALKIADCCKLSNDTNYSNWYKTVIETHKTYSSCDISERQQSKPFFQIAISYYWLRNYQQSSVWFEKAIIMQNKYSQNHTTSKIENEQTIYYCGKSYFNIQDFKNAKKYLSEYLQMKGDTLDVIQLIEKCK